MSVKTLVIVESPAKCQKIGGFLGPNYIVKASFGHIRGILDGLKAIDFANDYKIKYDIIETKKKQKGNRMPKKKSSEKKDAEVHL